MTKHEQARLRLCGQLQAILPNHPKAVAALVDLQETFADLLWVRYGRRRGSGGGTRKARQRLRDLSRAIQAAVQSLDALLSTGATSNVATMSDLVSRDYAQGQGEYGKGRGEIGMLDRWSSGAKLIAAIANRWGDGSVRDQRAIALEWLDDRITSVVAEADPAHLLAVRGRPAKVKTVAIAIRRHLGIRQPIRDRCWASLTSAIRRERIRLVRRNFEEAQVHEVANSNDVEGSHTPSDRTVH